VSNSSLKFAKIQCQENYTDNRIVIDWLRVSFDQHSWGWACALFDIDYTPENWIETAKFRKSFLTMPMDGVTIASEHLPKTGRDGKFYIDGRFIVDISGNGLGVYFAKNKDQTIEQLVRLCAGEDGSRVTRFDIAFDDFNRKLDIMKIVKLIREDKESSRVVTRWRGWRLLSSGDMFAEDNKGLTLYLGARSSGSFARLYDKRLEVISNAKKRGVDLDFDLLPDSWLRFELELKGKKSDAVVRDFLSSPLGFSPAYFTGVLRGLIEFKSGSRNGKKKSDLRAAAWWTSFCGLGERFPVSPPSPRQSIEKKIAWLERSVAGSLALVTEHYDGDMGFIYDLLEDGKERLTPQHRAMLKTVDHGV